MFDAVLRAKPTPVDLQLTPYTSPVPTRRTSYRSISIVSDCLLIELVRRNEPTVTLLHNLDLVVLKGQLEKRDNLCVHELRSDRSAAHAWDRSVWSNVVGVRARQLSRSRGSGAVAPDAKVFFAALSAAVMFRPCPPTSGDPDIMAVH